jgi:hypothetical protein
MVGIRPSAESDLLHNIPVSGTVPDRSPRYNMCAPVHVISRRAGAVR